MALSMVGKKECATLMNRNNYNLHRRLDSFNNSNQLIIILAVKSGLRFTNSL